MVYFVLIWSIFRPFGIFYLFGMLYQEKSGTPGTEPQRLPTLWVFSGASIQDAKVAEVFFSVQVFKMPKLQK
jgi:hypothetical protein